MRVLWATAVVLAILQGFSSSFAQQLQPTIPASQLVHEVVYNELNDHQTHGYWRYWVERHAHDETRLEEQVETAEGPIARLAKSNGREISAKAEREEDARLQHLLLSPEAQAHLQQEHAEDEQRVGRILALLPDAFLYEYDGEENGCYRLRFHPNPLYPAHSIEARVFHAMSGNLWIDAKWKRLARLDGRVEDNVDFGYGLLGRLNKGGWFQMVRAQVGANDWKTVRLEIHMNGRALMLKSFARETSEQRGGFQPIPSGLNLAQGMALLDQSRPTTAQVTPAAFQRRR